MNGWMRSLVWHRQTRPISRQWLRHSSPSLHSWVLFSFLLFFVFDLGRCTLSPAESALFLDSSQTIPQSIDLSWCNLSPRTRKKTLLSLFFFSRFHLYNREKKECETVEEIKFHTRKCSRKKIFTNSSTNVFVYVRFIYVSPQQEDTLHRGF